MRLPPIGTGTQAEGVGIELGLMLGGVIDLEERHELIEQLLVAREGGRGHFRLLAVALHQGDEAIGEGTHEAAQDLRILIRIKIHVVLHALLLTTTNVSLEMNKEIKVTHYLPATTERQAEITRMPIEYDYIPLYNPQSGFAAFLIPPVLMLIIQQTLFLGVGMSMGDSRERYRGSAIPFERSYKHPVHIVLGKSMLYFLLYLLMGIYMFTFVTR